MVWCIKMLALRAKPDRCRADFGKGVFDWSTSFRKAKDVHEERASDLESEALFRDTGLGT